MSETVEQVRVKVTYGAVEQVVRAELADFLPVSS